MLTSWIYRLGSSNLGSTKKGTGAGRFHLAGESLTASTFYELFPSVHLDNAMEVMVKIIFNYCLITVRVLIPDRMQMSIFGGVWCVDVVSFLYGGAHTGVDL